ncbi:MAG: LysE family transporter [Chitinophagaceae bacterium]|nr:LysE family transporter [Chitinophagaceae bacterium]
MSEALLKGITLGLLLSISVGPALFSVIKQSLNNGPRGGMAFAAGIFMSDVTLVLVANVFTELFRSLRVYEKQIGIAGSIFLVSMGIFFLFFKKVKVNEAGKQVFKHRKRDLAKISLSGFFMNLLNPAVIILWITISSSLILFSSQYKLVVYSTCLLIALLADVAKVLMAGKIRNRLTPHNIHIINRVNGIILIGFGAVLLWGLIFYADKLK